MNLRIFARCFGDVDLAEMYFRQKRSRIAFQASSVALPAPLPLVEAALDVKRRKASSQA